MKKATTTIPAGIECKNATAPTIIAAIVAPASGIRSRIPTISPSATAYGTPMITSTMAVRAPALPRRGLQKHEEAIDPGRALEQHEERQEDDRHRREHRIHDTPRQRERRPGETEQLRGTAFSERLARLVDEVVLRLQEPEPAAAFGEVVQVVGDLVREVVHLVDQRRDEQPADQRDSDQRGDEDDPGRDTTPLDASLEPVNGGGQRERQEQRDEDPGEDMPRDPEDLQGDERDDEDRDDHENRPGPEMDPAVALRRLHLRS